MSDDDEYAERRQQADTDSKLKASVERMHWRNLTNSESGLWLLRELMEIFETELKDRPNGNSWDMYSHGRWSVAKHYRARLIDNLGPDILPKLMKGKANEHDER